MFLGIYIMSIKLGIEQTISRLLAQLRRGDIWDISMSEMNHWFEVSNSAAQEVLSMRLCSMLAEIADRRGWWPLLPRALENIAEVHTRFFSQTALLSPEAKDLPWFRQAGWLLLHDARWKHRSRNSNDGSSMEQREKAAQNALNAAQRLQDHLQLIMPEAGNHELLYRTAFSKARHHQVLQRYVEAESDLRIALHHCYLHRSEVITSLDNLDANASDLALKQTFTLFNTAVVVANLGRINVDLGNLLQAQPQLLTARTMLLDSKDIVMRGFVDLQLGSVYRQLGTSGTSPSREIAFDPADLLKDAIAAFEKAGHRQLQARATLELAQHYYGLAGDSDDNSQVCDQLEKARACLKKQPAKIDSENSDRNKVERWDAESQLLRARIEYLSQSIAVNHDPNYGRQDVAIDDALEALKRCKEVGRKDLEAIAGLVLAELSIARNKYDEAIAYCLDVERLDPVDNADKAWLYIVFSNAWMKQGDRATAEAYFEQWKNISPSVQNARIRKKAVDVGNMLKTQRGFYIPPDGDLDFEKHMEELKLFLVQTVQATGSLQEQARKLGLKKQTLANWRARMIKEKKLEARPRFRRPRRDDSQP
jgi:tetratricopeptide (TPR) repeat protein